MPTKITNMIMFFNLILILSIIGSCSKNIHPQNSSESIIYPPPPDKARIQFLTTINTSLDVAKKKSTFTTFILGEEKPKGFRKPYGLSVFDGKIFICDLDLPGLEETIFRVNVIFRGKLEGDMEVRTTHGEVDLYAKSSRKFISSAGKSRNFSNDA